MDDEADRASQVPSRRADTVPQPRSGVLTSLRARWISPVSPHFKLIQKSLAWQVQDLATSRVTYWADTFIRRRLRGTNTRTTLAASGGFIYVVYGSDVTHIVCNPQRRVYHHIQAPPTHGPSHRIASMVVDAATQRYKIVLVGWGYSPHRALREKLMEISLFDSRVMTWRRLCRASVDGYAPLSSVVLDGVLYIMFKIFAPRSGLPLELYSRDLDMDTWRFIDVPLPLDPLQSIKTRPQLVAAAGRLFFMEYVRRSAAEEVISVFIWQIPLQGVKTVILATQLPRTLDFRTAPEYWKTVAPVQAVGCGDSIVVSTFLGLRWKWDAVQDAWQEMAAFSPVEPLAASHSFFVAPF